MSKGTIFKADAFNPNNFTYSSVKENKFGGRYSPVHSDKHTIRIETPKMLVPFGLSTYPRGDPNPQSYYLNLQFPRDLGERMKIFHDNLDKFDDLTRQTAMKNSNEWLGRKTLKENLAREYHSTFMYKSKDSEGNPNGEYPDQFTLKLKRKNGKFTVKCFGPDKMPADPSKVITKGCYVKAIMEINPIYFKKNSYSSSGTALQLRVFPATRLAGYAFLPDEDDDEVIVLGDLEEASRNVVPEAIPVAASSNDDDDAVESNDSSSSSESNSDESPPTKRKTGKGKK